MPFGLPPRISGLLPSLRARSPPSLRESVGAGGSFAEEPKESKAESRSPKGISRSLPCGRSLRSPSVATQGRDPKGLLRKQFPKGRRRSLRFAELSLPPFAESLRERPGLRRKAKIIFLPAPRRGLAEREPGGDPKESNSRREGLGRKSGVRREGAQSESSARGEDERTGLTKQTIPKGGEEAIPR